MTNIQHSDDAHLLEQTARIVATYASSNAMPSSDLTTLIGRIHATMRHLHKTTTEIAAHWVVPTAEQIESSIRPDGLMSFIDGRTYQTLRRHLTTHGLTPERYRARYGLPDDYPMVASNYAARRSQIAKAIGLGQKAV